MKSFVLNDSALDLDDLDLDDDLSVDFTSIINADEIDDSTPPAYVQNRIEQVNRYGTEYNNDTFVVYKALRLSKYDPFIDIPVDDEYAFKFADMWDPYTGERKGPDPYGPLYFDPDSLIKYFYKNRLNNLWHEPSDEEAGYFEGRYGDALGNGPHFEIKGRGNFIGWDIFRINIIDCYLTEDHNPQHPTVGPKLTKKEIKEIYELALKKDAHKGTNSYRSLFNKSRPNILSIKKYWDIATNPTPVDQSDPDSIKHITQDSLQEYYYKLNTAAVDALRQIRG